LDIARVLEVMRGDQRFAFPKNGFGAQIAFELAIQPRNDLLGLKSLRANVRGR
jgi:hypothetical protein